ncbi:MAG: hypothetical protein ABSC29_01585 [Minisyncoccia bacterium]|jgi:hypothetical protein
MEKNFIFKYSVIPIGDQAMFVPWFQETKEHLLANVMIKSFMQNRESISYFWHFSLIIEVSMDMGYLVAPTVVEILWHLFKEELIPIYSLVNVDRDWVPESTRQCFAEARKIAAVQGV